MCFCDIELLSSSTPGYRHLRSAIASGLADWKHGGASPDFPEWTSYVGRPFEKERMDDILIGRRAYEEIDETMLVDESKLNNTVFVFFSL